MKRILGLDLGTNSIGWALVNQDFDKKEGMIEALGARIIPMSQDILGKFGSGVSISQTAERTQHRSVRRLYERDHLRRERLHRVLNILGFLPDHYARAIDFQKRLGQFKDGMEIKLNYVPKPRPEKHVFLFMESFLEMVREFEASGHHGKIPYDWTLYYLRKKALHRPISKEELAWLILNFNQKRGYYQLRGEDAEVEDEGKREEFFALKVERVDCSDSNSEKAKDMWYDVHLENGWIYKRKSKDPLDGWVGKVKEFIVTTELDKDGSLKRDKDGEVKRSFRAVNSEEDWIAIKKKSEHDIDESGQSVGEFIYDTLLKNPTQKIRGKLVRTIERKYYRRELEAILTEQAKHHAIFGDQDVYNKCIEELYPHNDGHKTNIKDKGLIYLITEDIIFYQRPLKSKKSTIANCQYEWSRYKDDNGNEHVVFRKGIPRSHPLFQEFRLWQFLKNLKLYVKGNPEDVDVTQTLLPTNEAWLELFGYLSIRKETEQKDIIKYFIDKKLIPKADKDAYRWNYVQDKSYPCGETRAMILSRLNKIPDIDADKFLTDDMEKHIWHIIYSVKDGVEFEKALKKFAGKNGIDKDAFVEQFGKVPSFKNEYGSYSEKALKKLVPLMRTGRYWKESEVPDEAKSRVESIMERLDSIEFDIDRIQDVADDDITSRLLRSFIGFKDKNPLKGLNTFQACYAVYGRHSETGNMVRWNVPADIDKYLSEFKQHSLRNPIVEQVVTETLRVVRDIWQHYGNGSERFFDEIHVELGREIKNPKDKRKKLTDRITENQNTNERIKKLLQELKEDASTMGEVRPHSPSHQEILKIYEEGVSQNAAVQYDEVSEDEVLKIRKNTNPSKSEIIRYKLWLEQGYVSPYTGKVIPLSRLFTTDYQIEHIIPQSRYFDDSLNNKVICESAVNELKDNDIAYDFIKSHGGQRVDLGDGKTVDVLDIETYKNHCGSYFKNNRNKLKMLLSEDIPDGFIERQMNDSRYISKLVKGLLSCLVREENEQEATSKNIVTVPGAITAVLRNDWGLNDKWNALVAPRFQRLNELTNSQDYGYWDNSINAFRIQVPDSISKGFSKKRIDHRHHALDALVIACTTKDHVNYITSLNTERNNYALVSKLRVMEEIEKVNRNTGEIFKRKVAKSYHAPWPSFATDAADQLAALVVSFKQNLRVINKTRNKYWSYKDENGDLRLGKNGKPKKELVQQVRGDSWAIRKPLHKDTVSGKVSLKRKRSSTVSLNTALDAWEMIVDKDIKEQVKAVVEANRGDLKKAKKHLKGNPVSMNGKVVERVEMYEIIEATAVRVELTDAFTRKQLNSITDTGIQKILENHVKHYVDEKGSERFDLAFNPEGVEEMNRNMQNLNDGKPHQPIRKVRVYEVGGKFSVGHVGNKKDKYVEAAKGTNLFFAIYWNEEKQKREYDTIPLNLVVEHQKQVAGLPKKDRAPIPPNPEKGTFLFSLSPNDLVYVPTEEEAENPGKVDFRNLSNEQIGRIYKMVSASSYQCFYIRADVATTIVNKQEFTPLNKMERDIDGNMIKDCCWKLTVDRVGRITGFVK
ncbi:MAG: type II CRISPR RNA-guided endonuclease Cas9 [Cyclobacteriaceae bacterium]|nr:type II CRISPR RNA-guided endonuclease Cas9 [Cyclobacteriaceae bacterium]MCB9447011.1 CRISPR-associated protein Csn1 [Flavobacteriales bacterium]